MGLFVKSITGVSLLVLLLLWLHLHPYHANPFGQAPSPEPDRGVVWHGW